ncbi:MAG TPA: bifunctional [glutamine synthetase] adenylyltransferase/[glutamine synthetase]-adenylyl-L-tyrosine phosphorylase [Devosia sp.]|nr:bifunctional [glutamine synthetase] adenylyltransferase/[glutamine synthetase]-adenylyl-L-tyrosine phosphorylase [Devosia sp.]
MQLQPLPSGDDESFARWLAEIPNNEAAIIRPAAPLLGPLLSSAPYLLSLARGHTDFLAGLLQGEPQSLLQTVLVQIEAAGLNETDGKEFARVLRLAKGKIALLAAIAETGKAWTTSEAAMALSDFADKSVEACLNFLMRTAAQKGQLAEGAIASAANSGLAVFALGKHGGRELNYSSDIDIVAFYDPSPEVLANPAEAAKTYARIVRKLAALMQDRTEYGYVFRTDLRLRPDPGSTPPALPVEAALTYYEGRGQNWERAAWIKARQCAGDRRVGEMFLKSLAPFIWRKHLDFAAIADIQAMKRQINIARNVGAERLGGHNVKLGRGGIREIEFFTQTQQLIAGGREQNLRVRPTVQALSALAENRWISADTAASLGKTYWFLRAVENRIQMLNDEQTHSLPEEQESLGRIARLMGFEAIPDFESAYRGALEIVTANYTNLFAGENTLSSETGSLVFTGTDDDPATLETLSALGFDDPKRASATIRNWHYGRYAATRAALARARLTELIPPLLETISRAGNADEALARFDDFLSRLPMGVQLFAMLRAHSQLLQLLIAFMASAPRMADAVVRRAHVLDGLIDPARTGEVVDADTLVTRINNFLDEATGFEDTIERARILGQEQLFLISAGLISGTISASRAGRQFAALAQSLLEGVFARVREVFELRHGTVRDAKVALLAFGRLGSREMSVTSDLDMILLYDAPADAETSDGEKPLATSHYFTRLTQRLIAAISAQTAEGVLYQVDMRLRPSGNAGPLATSLKAFRHYQLEQAWTWEHMALTRARVVVADMEFASRIDRTINDIVCRNAKRERILTDARDMRDRLARERSPRHSFDLKLVPGGLMDIEFIAQSGTLIYGMELAGMRGDIPATLRALQKLGKLNAGEDLAEIYLTMSCVVQVMSACLTHPFRDEAWTPAFKHLLAGLCNYPDFSRLELELQNMRERVNAASNVWFDIAE